MNIYICDDEEKILNNISAVVGECCKDSNIYAFSRAQKLLEQIRDNKVHILLLDIDMPDIDGMEVANEIMGMESKPILIFVTSHDELVYESLRYHPFGFVRKRFLNEELPKLLVECKEEIEKEVKHFCFKADGKNVRLLLSDIYYFESEANYVKVFTKKGEYRFRSTMTAVENSLKSFGFIRIHKGFLVNQEAIQLMGTEETELTTGIKLPIGKMYLGSAKAQLMRYMR